jgi:hypothetical protein
MNDFVRIALIVVLPFLVVGGGAFLLAQFLRPKAQLLLWMPIIIAVDIWLGFEDGWKSVDFILLGAILVSGISGLMTYIKIDGKKH